jgi:chromosome segregation ATPase
VANDVEAAKLQAEIDKIRAETDALRKPTAVSLTNWVAVIGGAGALVAAITGTIIQWRVSDFQIERQKLEAQAKVLEFQQQIFKLKEERREIEEAKSAALNEVKAAQERVTLAKAELDKIQGQATGALATLKNQTANLVANVATTIGGAAAAREVEKAVTEATQSLSSLRDSATAASSYLARQNKTAYLQFKGGLSRDTMRGFQTQLQTAGYNVPGIERVAANYSSEIRYFKTEDEPLGKDVAAIASKYFADKCGLQAPVPAKLVAQSKSQVQVEVWISLNCGE